MKLDEVEATRRLAASDHGVLATVHPERGVDAIPVVFATDAGFLAIPIDRVKPKSSSKLQRERNLEADPRATLLIEHWDRADWTKLWWVRATLEWQNNPSSDRIAELSSRLISAFGQYREPHDRASESGDLPSGDQPFDRLLIFEISGISGWSSSTE